MSAVLRDLKHAARMLARNPVFTGVVVGTLALGIGLNTAVFSAIDALLLRPLPGVARADQLVLAYRTTPGDLYGGNSPAHYFDVRRRSAEVFSGVASWSFERVNISSAGTTQRVFAMMASANYFSMLGVSAERGRVFAPEEDTGEGAHPVIVLSHAGWKNQFGGDDHVVGRSVVLNGQPFTVIGVAQKDFAGTMPVVTPTLWVPLAQIRQVRPGGDNLATRDNNFLGMMGRLKPGVTLAQAAGRMAAISAELLAEYPNSYRDRGIELLLQSKAGIAPETRSTERGLSAILMAVVAMLLLIACVNVANLLLARARDRSREMAIRLGLGAGRGVVIRQLLTESMLLAVLSGAAGAALAWWVVGAVNRIRLPIGLDITPGFEVNSKVLAFTLALSLATGLIFGLVPALQATTPSLVPALKGETPSGGSKSRLSRGLVITQVALSIILLISAGLFLHDLKAATAVDKGFNSANLLLADLDPGLQGYSRARMAELYTRLLERLRAAPDVAAVGLADNVPLGISGSDWSVTIPGYTPGPSEDMSIHVSTVTPGYFEAMGTPLLAGHDFTGADDSTAAHTVVVNQRFVDRFWPGQRALGRVIQTGRHDHTIVGVVPTGKYQRLGEAPMAYMFMPNEQHFTRSMSVLIRTRGDPMAAASLVRTEVAAFDPDLPVSDVRTMESHLGFALLAARLSGSVLGIFGGLGLLLASIGIYGVMAGAVSQRRKEIGIRIAIGAAGEAIVRLLVREGLVMVGIGTTIGMIGALAASRVIGSMLYSGTGLDWVTFISVPLILGAVALLAIWLPARKASSVDPVITLRA